MDREDDLAVSILRAFGPNELRAIYGSQLSGNFRVFRLEPRNRQFFVSSLLCSFSFLLYALCALAALLLFFALNALAFIERCLSPVQR